MPIHVEIVTQEAKIFDEPEADMVVIPASEGEMGVLPQHAPVLTTLAFGECIVRKGDAEESFVVYGGVVDVRPGKVVLLADLAESSYALDAQAAEEARTRAHQAIEQGVEDHDRRAAVLELRRAELAARVSRKVTARGGPQIRILSDEDVEE